MAAVSAGLVVLLYVSPGEGAELSSVELAVLDAPQEVSAASSFYVQVKITNTGAVPLRGCLIELGRVVSSEPCVTLGYRFGKAPTRFKVDSVDPLPVLLHSVKLAPGESLERSVRLVSPRRDDTGTLHLYAISGRPDALVWVHRPLSVSVGPAPYEVRRREFVTLGLFALYVVGVGWALFRLFGAIWRGRRRSCSS